MAVLVDTLLGLGARFGRARFERQLEALLPELYRTARGLAGGPVDAEDLVHDACVKAFAAFPRADIRGEAACRGWLHRILVNTYRDRYRQAARSPVRAAGPAGRDEDGQTVVELAPSPESPPEDAIHGREFARAVRDALGTLPPEVRVVSVLFLLNGLPYKEIAVITDCPVGTVMSRLSRGRRLLRERLSEYHPNAVPGATAAGSNKP